MGKIKELVGKKYGRLTVQKYLYIQNHKAYWLCKCDCGGEKITSTFALTTSQCKSCGCLPRENGIRLNKMITKHNMSSTRVYRILAGMKRRCYNPKDKEYHCYGGRGIKICDEWLDKENGYKNFCEWALSNGYDNNKKGTECSIDRIDNNGDYCPENCRFVTMKEQCNNLRKNKRYDYNGENYTISQLSEKDNIPYCTLFWRLKKWDIEKALTEPVKIQRGKNDKK